MPVRRSASPPTTFVAPSNWVPTNEDVRNMDETLNQARISIAQNIAQHSYNSPRTPGDFPSLSYGEYEQLAVEVMSSSAAQPVATGSPGRVLFYNQNVNVLVIVNTNPGTSSTMMRPSQGLAYVNRLLGK